MDHESRVAAWTIFSVVFAAKLVTLLMILFYAPAGHVVLFLFLMNWPWLLAVIALLAIPALFWTRMLRGRAKRARLLKQEWCLEERPAKQPATAATPTSLSALDW